MSYTTITRIGTDHTIWQKGFGFYKDELDIMESRLSQVAGSNTTFEARQGVEHFQNQFIVQRNNIDELKHEVNLYIEKLGADALKHGGRMETGMISEHTVLHQKYEDFERVMNILRHEFNEYLSKWM
ncbi:MAG: hypothetical protein HYZ15_08690 [Sphingobacteriales bacterium]|nr:hypothetical protein [Sphingobacteriales bacterium]